MEFNLTLVFFTLITQEVYMQCKIKLSTLYFNLINRKLVILRKLKNNNLITMIVYYTKLFKEF